MLLVLEHEAVEAEEDHHADDGSDEAAEIECLVVADAEKLGEDEEADDGSSEPSSTVAMNPILSRPGISRRPM